jgi:hypothetical protein
MHWYSSVDGTSMTGYSEEAEIETLRPALDLRLTALVVAARGPPPAPVDLTRSQSTQKEEAREFQS